MQKRPKFNPEITRVELNPEQAVLACNCHTTGFMPGGAQRMGLMSTCYTEAMAKRYSASEWWDVGEASS